MPHLRNRTGYHIANPSHTKYYTETYPKTAYYEKPVLTKSTSTYHHEVPQQNTSTTVPPPGHNTTRHTTTSESPLTNLNNNCANTMAHLNSKITTITRYNQ
ncbi:hypothetical protein Taro_012384 [Colocasia esculenta]|uniref:Uncharacterized protein n=1 Tax=Colocasia esculenta TaxID=4460 RepID=A0A843U8Z8_COLES|nr:hypothetical protein [Colocasia esculenta]